MSGSHYEWDQGNNRIRRLAGVNDPTSRQGLDGEWRDVYTVIFLAQGQGACIIWKGDVEPTPETMARIHAGELTLEETVPATMTSPVTSITKVEEGLN